MSRLFLNYLKPVGLLLIVAAPLSSAAAQQVPIGSLRNSIPALAGVYLLGEAPAPPVLRRSPERVIADLVTVEAKVREALNHHTFKRDVVLQTIGLPLHHLPRRRCKRIANCGKKSGCARLIV